ncbi:hypothetical protein [Myxococcus fulvus]|uniref:hypothetical protein n=1 Tax=Myxococcus fulvus TaxID=33 RepID=UPI0020BE0E59|nr:hypothetical protein [Myxococcus fulvus]MCK8501742.1 hypothetical protein [Myxococcus fulvus]
MHRIDGDGNIAGQFTEGNPGAGVPATQVTDDWLNTVQEEIAGVCETNGALVKANNGQLLAALDARYPRTTTTSTLTWNSAAVVNASGTTGEALALKPGASANHAYLAFYARTASPTVRSGYIGYGAAAATTLTLANDLASGGVAITPGTSGNVAVGRSGGTVSLVGNTSVAGSLTVDNVVTGSSGGPALQLKPGASANHVYLELYARSLTPTTRSGYLGYATAGGSTLSLVNSLNGGNVELVPGSGGKITVSGDVSFTGVSNPGAASPTTNTITPVSIAKVWAMVVLNGSGVASLQAGHNVSSVALVAITSPITATVIRVTFASSFASSDYCPTVSNCTVNNGSSSWRVGPRAAGSIDIVMEDRSGVTKDPATNFGTFSLQIFGAQ